MTSIEPMDYACEQGILLALQIGRLAPESALPKLAACMREIERLRGIERGLRTELSVHERRVRVSGISMLTGAEEAMLKFCVDAGFQVFASNSGTFTEEDHKAMNYLLETFEV